jgi:hypothetical protein
MKKQIPIFLIVAALLGVPAAFAGGQTAETRSEVPALTAFHEVIVPLWHEAWPSKNYGMMKEMLPQVREHMAKVSAAELPGILRDKKPAWDQRLAELKAVVARYEAAAAKSSEQGLLDAVEELHAKYEAMVRLTRPVMKELDAFHVVLYRVYHHELPAKAIDRIAVSAGELGDRCQTLGAAPVPKSFASLEPKLRPAIALLCEQTGALKTVVAGKDPDATAKAVETVHSQYEKVEAIFP